MDLRPDLKTKKQVRLRAAGHCDICIKPITSSVLTGWFKSSPICQCDKSAKTPKAEFESDGTVHGANHDETALPDLGPDFEPIQLLGHGGMGQVFKVKNKIDGSILAVKVLKSELTDDKEALKRFAQEISAVSNLDHENIIAVHSQGITAGGAPYLVMDYINGLNLADSLKQNAGISDVDAVQIFSDLAKALEAAHASGILHRDLKPSNVMLTETADGAKSSKLADFGISKLMPADSTQGRETSDLTKTGDIFGTPGYMSPEQCLGFKLDERSDIYSLGCMMYEILSGSAPFVADNPIQIVIKQINDEPAAWVSARGDTFAKKLESIVLKCLEKQPEKRYQSARELIDELDKLRSGEKITAGIRKKEKKAHLTKFQFVGLFFFSIYVVAFFTSTGTLGDLNSLNLFITALPFALLYLYKYRKRFRLPQAELVQWLILRSILGTVLGLLSLLLLFAMLGFFESIPAVPVFAMISIFVIVTVFSATLVAELFSGQETRVSLKAVCKKMVLPAVIMMIPLALILPGHLQNIAEYMVHGLRWQEHLSPHRCKSPNFAYELLRFGNLFHAKSEDGALLEADCLLAQNKPSEATKILCDAIAKSKTPNELNIKLASTYDADNQHEKALAELNNLKSKTEDTYHHQNTLKALGEHFFRVGDFKKAEETYTYAINEIPDSLNRLHEARAAARWRSGDRDGAIADLSKELSERSLRSEPETILIKRGLCFEQNNNPEAALKDFKEAQTLMARNMEHLDKGMLIIAKFTDTVGVSERYSDTLLKSALVSSKLGQVEKSKKYLSDAAIFDGNKDDFLADFKEQFAFKKIW